MEDTLLLAIAITDTVTIAVADLDGAVIVQTAYPNDVASEPDPFLGRLVEEAQVLLYPLPGQLGRVGLASAMPAATGWLASRLVETLKAPVVGNMEPLPVAECTLERAIELARRDLA